MTQISVLHISTANSWRGGEQQVAFLMDALKQDGVKQMLLCPKNTPLELVAKQKGFPYESFDKKSGMDFKLARKIRKLVRNLGFNLIHAHDSHAHTAAFLGSLLGRKNFSIVVNRRVAFPLKGNFFSKLKYNHKSIKKIICVSKAVEKVVLQKVNHQRTTVLYSRIPDITKSATTKDFLIKELNLNVATKVIGHIGAFTGEKGHECFVHTAEILIRNNKNLHFVLAGKGPNEETIKKLVQDRSLQSAFTFLGFRKDIHAVIAGMDILLFTSMSEGLGTAVLDALKEETPVVAFATGGLPEIVISNKTGVLVNNYSPDYFATAVEELLADPKLVQKIILEGKEHLKHFSTESLNRDIMKIYLECV